jgi:hypothetical protein|tara:strand:- start:1593 stop:2120 length:528 start_codon:yes stop_codon:yes gene_type:complete
MGAAAPGTALVAAAAEEAAERADEAAELIAPLAEEAAELMAPLADELLTVSEIPSEIQCNTYAAEAAADEAEFNAPEAAELAEAARLEAALAALPVSEPKTVLKPVVVVMTEPAELVMVPTRGTVVTALWATDASEPVTEAAADAAAPDALARAEVRIGTAASEPEAADAAPVMM